MGRNGILQVMRMAVAGFISAMAFAGMSAAQGLDGLGTLGQLLQQIDNSQVGGFLGERRSSSQLDRSRENALQKKSGKTQQKKEDPKRQERRAFENRVIAAFCSGDDRPEILRAAADIEDFSALEKDYCLRAGVPLRQFGYGLFANDADNQDTQEQLLNGAISDSYILGIGDELVFNFRGPKSRTVIANVDREGRVLIDELPPVPAAGRSFGEFRRAFKSTVASSLLGTDVFVSLGQVRAMSVLVAGDVKNPGIKQVTGLSTIVDALKAAGGIRKTGSLRRIQLQRGENIFWIDLYDLIVGGGLSHERALREGDKIIVPVLGATVAIAGNVKRPGIYELPEGKKALTLKQALSLAGGTLRPRGNVYQRARIDEQGRDRIAEIRDEQGLLGDGDILTVDFSNDIRAGRVELTGHVRLKKIRPLAVAPTVARLIGSASALKPDPYLPLAVLETTDPQTFARHYVAIDLQPVMSGKSDIRLREFDRLIVLGAEDVAFLSSRAVQEILLRSRKSTLDRALEETDQETKSALSSARKDGQAKTAPPQQQQGRTNDPASSAPSAGSDGAGTQQQDIFSAADAPGPCKGLQALQRVVESSSENRFAAAVNIRTLNSRDDRDMSCPELFREEGDLLPFLLEHSVLIAGEVRNPGIYPLAGSAPLTALVAVAGGVSRNADLTRVEWTRYAAEPYAGVTDVARKELDANKVSFASVELTAGDVLRFPALFSDRDTGTVELHGEFVRPGIYDIRRGETLSQLIRRAGGLTAQAYPYGAIFTRERVRLDEQQSFLRASRELNASLAAVAVNKGVDPSALVALQQLSERLNKVRALGRVVIEADPAVLQIRPELDTVLEPGDKIFMPKRPNFVTVIGDVLNPGALQFVPGASASLYIRQAGGFQRSADKGKTFVVLPDGRAQPLSLGPWNIGEFQIPPGSSIIVPKDPAPFDLANFLQTTTELVSRLAVTAASFKVLTE